MVLLKQIPESVKNPKIFALIERYNQLSELDKSSSLMKLFLLQKIDYLLQKENSNFEVLTWQSQLGPSGIEAHLQKYGIHRDASTLLKNIEFANAVRYYDSNEIAPTSGADFFTIIRQRDTLFDSEIGDDTLKKYVEYNQSIMTTYDNDQKMQDKAIKSKHFLSLCYAKMDSIKGFVKQEFSDYKTAVLGNPEGNNKNFMLTVDGEEEKLVIRVEDRNTLASEPILQAHSVSEYFSDDYVTFMMPFQIDGRDEYRPVVLSEFAKKGSLDDYAKRLVGQNPGEIGLQAVNFFTQLNDFCLKLIESGHYHPDIKLSNFLTDGERIIVSDRKTITDKRNPQVNQIHSSPAYGAPEYQACLNPSGDSMNFSKARNTTLDMPSYMSYQQGMALKEFMFLSMDIAPENFFKWSSFTKSQDDRIKNISVLIQELTRDNPKDRLSIDHFQSLLADSNLSPKLFLEKLDTLSPRKNLSTNTDLELIEKILHSKDITPELDQQLREFETRSSLKQVCNDPRINIAGLLADLPSKKVRNYLNDVNKKLHDEDYNKSTPWRQFISHYGFPIRRVTKITDLASLPPMDTQTELCYKIMATAEYNQFPGISLVENRKLKEVFDHQTVLRKASNTPDHTAVNNKSELASSTTIEYPSGTCVRTDEPVFSSGTCVRTDEPVFSSGTCVRTEEPVFSSGTCVITEEPVLSSSTCIIKDDLLSNSGSCMRTDDPVIHHVESVDKMDDKIANQSNIKRALQEFKKEEQHMKPEDSNVEDIESTITRGNLMP